MKKVVLTGATVLAAMMVASPALADEGWYGRADVGYSFDGELDLPNTPTLRGADLDEDWTQSLGLGYEFDSNVRLEGELAHRFNSLESTPFLRAGSDAHAWSALLNAYYDFGDGRFQPYIGAGVGAAQVSASALSPDTLTRFDDDDTGFAWQAMAGVGIGLTDRLTLDLGYRFFAVPNLEYSGTQGGVPRTFETSYENQSATVGLRWQFASPPPPPPPPAPPPPPPPPPPVAAACPAADFVVYFEWDRSTLNQAALETIDSAVNRARNCNLGAVSVTGHTDTSVSAAYNVGLSERRASVVAEALVARGLPAGAITSQARGETDLAQATRDGVREPLNRRTAVTISFR